MKMAGVPGVYCFSAMTRKSAPVAYLSIFLRKLAPYWLLCPAWTMTKELFPFWISVCAPEREQAQKRSAERNKILILSVLPIVFIGVIFWRGSIRNLAVMPLFSVTVKETNGSFGVVTVTEAFTPVKGNCMA